MSFVIMTDTGANLTAAMLEQYRVEVIPLTIYLDGKPQICRCVDELDPHEFYSTLRDHDIRTAQVNPQAFLDAMAPHLQAGKDILFISLSSGVSGTQASACIAAKQLAEEYPSRRIEIFDSLGASFGEGLLVLRAFRCRERGLTLAETVAELLPARDRMCQIFAVDDLYFLRKNGRLSSTSMIVANLLDIKPVLKGNEHGKIVASAKVRGRKRSIIALAERYESLVKEPEKQCIAISHADCPEDAAALVALIQKNKPPKEILVVDHEPSTGVHVGPGMLAVYFEGEEGSRYL